MIPPKFLKSENWGIHWFRRDLRVAGNEALRENWKRNKGRTLGLFCFDSTFLSRSDFSHHRFAFFLKTLMVLRAELQEQGGDLLVVDALPMDVFGRLFQFCRSQRMALPSLISWGRDYEPFARARDHKVQQFLTIEGIKYLECRDHLIFEPEEILKTQKPNDFYQVYSPFAKRWLETLASPLGLARIESQDKTRRYYECKQKSPQLFRAKWSELVEHRDFPFDDALEHFIDKNSQHVSISIPEAGFVRAYGQLLEFKEGLQDYRSQRDIPSVDGTSRLSIYLKNGSLTSAQVVDALRLQVQNWAPATGPNQYLKEIIWREFYYSILYHRPEVEHKSFNPKFENIEWENNPDFFARWKEGTTGFPIVDAGMRQLRTTGWMHNRVRMIVASFLTKDLLIDWRWGENHFMKELLDGDLAANNGGWQWAASTGCDPQPYFRIFNPWLQSAKFDPDGLYIKTFVSELTSAPAKILHDPSADRSPWKYPKPIVDHSVQRAKAIRLYKGS